MGQYNYHGGIVTFGVHQTMTTTLSSTDALTDKDWRNLLREIHSGQVIPVIGPGLVTITDPASGAMVQLYRYRRPEE
jgi:hypothetical protein